MLTIRPAPRCPVLGSTLFSMTRTGMPLLNKVRASISPEGPAPTYAIKSLKLLAIDQKKSRTIRTWGAVGREIMLQDLDGLGDDFQACLYITSGFSITLDPYNS